MSPGYSRFSQQSLPEFEQLLRESRQAVRDFRDLSRSLKQNPSQLIYESNYRGIEVPQVKRHDAVGFARHDACGLRRIVVQKQGRAADHVHARRRPRSTAPPTAPAALCRPISRYCGRECVPGSTPIGSPRSIRIGTWTISRMSAGADRSMK